MRWTSRAIWAALAPGPSRVEAIDHSVSPAWTVWVCSLRALGAGAVTDAGTSAAGVYEGAPGGVRTGAGGRRDGAVGRDRFGSVALAVSRRRLTGATLFLGVWDGRTDRTFRRRDGRGGWRRHGDRRRRGGWRRRGRRPDLVGRLRRRAGFHRTVLVLPILRAGGVAGDPSGGEFSSARSPVPSCPGVRSPAPSPWSAPGFGSPPPSLSLSCSSPGSVALAIAGSAAGARSANASTPVPRPGVAASCGARAHPLIGLATQRKPLPPAKVSGTVSTFPAWLTR